MVDEIGERQYNRNKLANKVSDSVVEIQQKELQKVVDKDAERHYN